MKKWIGLIVAIALLSLPSSVYATATCAMTGNISHLYAVAASGVRVSYKGTNTQNPTTGGTNIVPGGDSCSVFTDSSGNLPTSGNCTSFYQGVKMYVTVGGGQPVLVQVPLATSVDLSTLIMANTDPPSLVTDVQSANSNCTATNPGTGSIGTSTINCGSGGGSWVMTNLTAGPGAISIIGNGTSTNQISAVNVNRTDVATAWGLKGDLLQYGTGNGISIANASTSLTCTSCTFTSADVGKAFYLKDGAGSGVTLQTTISAFVSAHVVTLAAPNSSGSNITDGAIAYGTDNTTKLQAMLDDAVTNSKDIFFPAGHYLYQQAHVIDSSIHLHGAGEAVTRLQCGFPTNGTSTIQSTCFDWSGTGGGFTSEGIEYRSGFNDIGMADSGGVINVLGGRISGGLGGTTDHMIDGNEFTQGYAPTITISSCSNTSPIVCTTSTNHWLLSNEQVTITGASVAGINSTWTVTVTGAKTFSLDGSSASGASTGGTFTGPSYNVMFIGYEQTDFSSNFMVPLGTAAEANLTLSAANSANFVSPTGGAIASTSMTVFRIQGEVGIGSSTTQTSILLDNVGTSAVYSDTFRDMYIQCNNNFGTCIGDTAAATDSSNNIRNMIFEGIYSENFGAATNHAQFMDIRLNARNWSIKSDTLASNNSNQFAFDFKNGINGSSLFGNENGEYLSLLSCGSNSGNGSGTLVSVSNFAIQGSNCPGIYTPNSPPQRILFNDNGQAACTGFNAHYKSGTGDGSVWTCDSDGSHNACAILCGYWAANGETVLYEFADSGTPATTQNVTLSAGRMFDVTTIAAKFSGAVYGTGTPGISGGGSLATGSNQIFGTVTSSAATGNVLSPGFTCPHAVVCVLSDETTKGGTTVTAVGTTSCTYSATLNDTVDYIAGCR